MEIIKIIFIIFAIVNSLFYLIECPGNLMANKVLRLLKSRSVDITYRPFFDGEHVEYIFGGYKLFCTIKNDVITDFHITHTTSIGMYIRFFSINNIILYVRIKKQLNKLKKELAFQAELNKFADMPDTNKEPSIWDTIHTTP